MKMNGFMWLSFLVVLYERYEHRYSPLTIYIHDMHNRICGKLFGRRFVTFMGMFVSTKLIPLIHSSAYFSFNSG